MNLKEFKEVLNRIPADYDDVEVSFICDHRERLVKDAEYDIEWYMDDIHNDEKRVDITLS